MSQRKPRKCRDKSRRRRRSRFGRNDWLGRQDSNLGMAESKSTALPLGYAPKMTMALNADTQGHCKDRKFLVFIKGQDIFVSNTKITSMILV